MPNIVDLSEYAGGGSAGLRPINLLSIDQLRDQAQAMTWLVKHVVPAESVGVMFGGSGTFKSFIALDMALHVAHGLKWMGRKTRKAPVFYIAAEGGSGLWRRIEAWHRHRGLRWTDVEFYVLPVGLDVLAEASRLREAAKAIETAPGLVIVDTLSQTFSGEENSATDVSAYLREVGLQFRECWQCAVLVIHHSGHQATERPRGSSAIRANVDFMFGVFRDEEQMLATLECHKQKDGDLFDAQSFELHKVELEHDEDGDAITSLVARRLSTSGEVAEAVQQEARRGRGGHNAKLLDLAISGIEEKQLRTLFYESTDGDSESKRKAYYRARKWATSAGLIEIVQGVILRPRSGT